MEQPTSSRHAVSLLVTGSLLIVLAIFILISSSWNSFPLWARLLVAALPVIILYTIGFSTRRQAEHRQKMSDLIILTASVIFPFVLGFILVQSGIYQQTDSLLIFLVSLISLLWFFSLEFLFLLPYHAPLSIIAGVSLAASFGDVIQAQPVSYSFFGIVLGYFFLSLGWFHNRHGSRFAAQAYGYAGTVFGWLGLVSLPANALHLSWIDLRAIAAYLPVSLAFFLVAIIYGLEYAYHKVAAMGEIRVAAEQSSAWTLTLPAIIACLSNPGSDNPTLVALAAVLIGIISLAISSVVQVRSFRTLGLVATVLGVVKILFFTFTSITAGWILFLLLLGFALIAVAYYLPHLSSYQRLWGKLTAQPERSFAGLGLPLPTTNDEPGESRPNSCLEVAVKVILVYLAIGFLFSFLVK